MSRITDSSKGKNKSKKKTIIILVIVVIIFVMLFSGNKNVEEDNKITTEELTRRTLVTSISAVGTLESTNSRDVSALVSGVKVEKVNVKVGDTVEKGDVICTFDMESVESSLNTAKTSLEIATEQANMSVDTAEESKQDAVDALVDLQEVLAPLYEKRDELIEKFNVAYAEKVDAEKYGENSAEFIKENTEAIAIDEQIKIVNEQILELEKTYGTLESSIDAAEKGVKSTNLQKDSAVNSASAQVDAYTRQLKNGIVIAETAGTITSLNVTEGELFAGGTVAKIEGTNSFKVVAEIDEYDIPDVKVGMKVIIKTDATRDEELIGEIVSVAPAATTAVTSALSVATSTASNATYKIEIAVNSENDRLRIGMNARLSIITNEAENVLSVPYAAIEDREDGKSYIKVLDTDGITEKEIVVTKGLESDYYTEVSSSELKEGMNIIVPEATGTNAMDALINTMMETRGM